MDKEKNKNKDNKKNDKDNEKAPVKTGPEDISKL